MGEKGEVANSSDAVSEPAGGSAAASSRTVFLSYASADALVANQVCEFLESHGVSCWMAPRDVRPGAAYADAIVRAINEASALVLLLSASAMASEHVSREVERAGSKHKQIVAFRIDAAALSAELEYFLSRSQWIDVPALGMPGALVKLAEAVGQGATGAQANPGFGGGGAPGGASIVNRAVSIAAVAKRVVVAAAVVLGIGGMLAVRFWQSKHGESQAPVVATISEKSIAVLPFADMSQKKDQEYFGDGMAEEILDLLAKIPGLTVIGRTSSFQFKGKNEDLRRIGTELNAAYVLEGSVRNSGDQVRITAQLINTRTGAHEWSETYDRPVGDVLKLQDTIAAAVVRELQLTVADRYLVSRAAVRNVEAHDLVLRGRHAADRWDEEGLDEAVRLFQQALERDATSADAAAELAFAYYKVGAGGLLASAAAFERARRAVETALRLDSKNALAHYVLGKIHIVYDWDWPAADDEFRQVATLAPGSADALSGEARVSLVLGRWDDALRQINGALAQDPLDAIDLQALMLIQARRGNLPGAEAAIRRLLDIHPTWVWGRFYLGLALLARREPAAALVEMQQETTDEGRQAGLAMAYFALGKEADSDAAVARMVEEHAKEYAFYIAEVYAFRGQSDEVMRWLERAYAQKDPFLCYLKPELPLKSLAADPRYKAFLKKMNLPE